jgi:hypothetical protein
MFKWGSSKDNSARKGGHNVTGALVHFDVSKPQYRFLINSEIHIAPAAPGLPYKLRKRMVRELKGDDCLTSPWPATTTADNTEGVFGKLFDELFSGLFKVRFWELVLYVCVATMWVAVWFYAGLVYGK